jgi:hypothetical protein
MRLQQQAGKTQVVRCCKRTSSYTLAGNQHDSLIGTAPVFNASKTGSINRAYQLNIEIATVIGLGFDKTGQEWFYQKPRKPNQFY